MADETKVQVTTTTTVKEISYRGYPVMVEVAKYDDGGNRIKDTYATLSEMHGATEQIEAAVGTVAAKVGSDDLKTINGKTLTKSDDAESIDADVQEIAKAAAQALLDEYSAEVDGKLEKKLEKQEVSDMIGESLKSGALKFEIAESLDSIASPSSTVIYLVKASESSDGDEYDEYVHIDDKGFERIGGTGSSAQVDLSDYYTKAEADEKIAQAAEGKAPATDIDDKSTLDSKATTAGTFYYRNASDAPSGKIYKYGKFSDVKYPEGTLEVTSTKRGFKNVWEPAFAENVKFVRDVETGDSNQKTSFKINEASVSDNEETDSYSFDGKTLTIKDGGQYHLSGRLNGNIVVSTTAANPDCELIFDGFDLYSADVGHAILFDTVNLDEEGDPDAKFLITIPEETVNTIFLKSNVDVEKYDADEHSKTDMYIGAIVAADKLTFDGVGTLAIVAKGYQTHAVNAKNIVIEGYLRMYISGTHDGFHARHTFGMMNGYVVIDRVDVDAIVGDYANVYGGKLFISDWGLRSPAGWAAQAIDCTKSYEDSGNNPRIWGNAEVHLSGVHAPARLNTGKGKGYSSGDMETDANFFFDREWEFAPGTKLYIDEESAKGTTQRVTDAQYEAGKDSFKRLTETWYAKDGSITASVRFDDDSGTHEYVVGTADTDVSKADHIVYDVINLDGSTYEWHKSFKDMFGESWSIEPATCKRYGSDGTIADGMPTYEIGTIADEYGEHNAIYIHNYDNGEDLDANGNQQLDGTNVEFNKPEYTIRGYVPYAIRFVGFGTREDGTAASVSEYNNTSTSPRVILDGACITVANSATISYQKSAQYSNGMYTAGKKNLDVRTSDRATANYVISDIDESIANGNTYDSLKANTKYEAGYIFTHEGRIYQVETDIPLFTEASYPISSDSFDALTFSAISSEKNIHLNLDAPLYVTSHNKHGIVADKGDDIEIKGRELYLLDIGSAGLKGAEDGCVMELLGKDYNRLHIYADTVGKVMQIGKKKAAGGMFYGIDYEVIATNYDKYLYSSVDYKVNLTSEDSSTGKFCAFYAVPGSDGKQYDPDFCTIMAGSNSIDETAFENGSSGVGYWASLKYNDDSQYRLNLTNVESSKAFPSDVIYPWQQYNTADYTYDTVATLNATITNLSDQIDRQRSINALQEDLLATQVYYDYPKITFTVADTLTGFVVKKGNQPDEGEPEREDMMTFGKNIVVAYNKDGEGYDKGDEVDSDGNSSSTAQFNCVVKASEGKQIVAQATPNTAYNKCTVVKDANTGATWISLTKVIADISIDILETTPVTVTLVNNTSLTIEDSNKNPIATEANNLSDFIFKVCHNKGAKQDGGYGYVSSLTIGGVESIDKLVCDEGGKNKDTYRIAKDYITGDIVITITEPTAA